MNRAGLNRLIRFCFLCLVLILPSLAQAEQSSSCGLFVSLIQDPSVLSSRQEIIELIDFAKGSRINVLFVQVYRANQACFSSQAVDSGLYNEYLANLSEDPFAFLIKQAHSAGIEVHAWLNMLSLSQNKNARILKEYGTSILTRNVKAKKTIEDYKIDDQYFLEPGDLSVRTVLLNMVTELLLAYPDLDGVQFDYLRYPDKNPAYGYTKTNIERFKKSSGLKTIKESSPAWQDWKRNQVTEFLELLVKKTRAIRPQIKISATGCMPYTRAYYEAFQDWPLWLDRGVVDFVTIMNYSASPSEFAHWIILAKEKVRDFKKVNIGVGAYKLVDAPELFREEFRICEESGGGDCVVFHYGSLLKNPLLCNSLNK
jgi:uncharacterized lipoprotein YddW (UPF0748 family)